MFVSLNWQDKADKLLPLNLAYAYDSDFHVAFAMLAFTGIIVALIVFGIALAMWNMDPGKDSIIYRATSQRVKKDQ